jgi:Uri superfamily endonuclease
MDFNMKGCYILIIGLKTSQKIQIGKIGKLFFKKGFYVYVGSSMNNLEKRINRHLSKEKKFHWHIDYLLEKAEILEVYLKENTIKEECRIAQILNEKLENIAGFGCSDCRCSSHLFYASDKNIGGILLSLDFKKVFNAKH